MPLYEYNCRGCGKRFEVLQRVGADSTGVVCPSCGAAEVSKQLSTFASAIAGSSASASTLPCGKPSSAGCGGGGFS
jgi:putative FmdB family regulatory protein